MRTHTGPFCANPDCRERKSGNRIVVKDERDICGFCALGYTFGAKEQAVFTALVNHDFRFSHFVRDKAMGCGTRRRPDAYADLHVNAGRVLFIVEVDEHQHRMNSVECELGRIQEIQDRHGGAVYVVRYNPDQKGGLEDSELERLAERCVEILDTDHEEALDAFGGFIVEYNGYSDARLSKLDKAWFDSQTAIKA